MWEAGGKGEGGGRGEGAQSVDISLDLQMPSALTISFDVFDPRPSKIGNQEL